MLELVKYSIQRSRYIQMTTVRGKASNNDYLSLNILQLRASDKIRTSKEYVELVGTNCKLILLKYVFYGT